MRDEAPAPAAGAVSYSPDEPVGLEEIAGRLAVKRDTADHWRTRGVLPLPDWPSVGGRPAWKWRTVERWARQTGRLDGPRAVRPDPWRPGLPRDDYQGILERLADLPRWVLVMTEPRWDTGCLVYRGKTDDDGYGRTWSGQLLHRVMYERLAGPIPDGMTLDHVRARGCISSACWAPWHLEPVTEAENQRRRGHRTTGRPDRGTRMRYYALTGRERPDRGDTGEPGT